MTAESIQPLFSRAAYTPFFLLMRPSGIVVFDFLSKSLRVGNAKSGLGSTTVKQTSAASKLGFEMTERCGASKGWGDVPSSR